MTLFQLLFKSESEFEHLISISISVPDVKYLRYEVSYLLYDRKIFLDLISFMSDLGERRKDRNLTRDKVVRNFISFRLKKSIESD